MSILKALFGPSKEEIWRKLATQIEGEFIDGGFFNKDKVIAKHGEWEITLDTITRSSGKSRRIFTRIQAPYVNKDGFRFRIYRAGLFTGLGKFFGIEDLEVGYEEFDRDFVIQGNDPYKLEMLFENERIRHLISLQPTIDLQVKDDFKWFKRSSIKEVDDLHFEIRGVIKNIQHLKWLFMLFAEILSQLCVIGAAYDEPPRP